jgi:ABC-2 type transport system ATP-binding protein
VTKEPVIVLEGVRKTFRDFWLRPTVEAVRGVDLTVSRGDVFGLLGPNGSGKSTTIKMILGLLSPTAGSVRLFGLPPRAQAARARIGYLPELSSLHPFLTAKETLMYYAGLSGLPAKRAHARTAALLEEVGLTAAANRAVGGFSKGMARRVALAAALVAEPELLILDEPTSGLDPIGTRDVKDMIRSLAASGVTILMTSHLLGDTEDVCTHIAILSKGRVAACGRTDELLTRREDVRFTVSGLTAPEAQRLTDEMTARYGPRVLMDHPRVPLEDFFAATLQEAT